MNLQKYTPSAPLDTYVDSIIYLQDNNKGTGLPKTAMSIVFNLEDSFKVFDNNDFSNHIDYHKYWVAGLQTKPTFVESYGHSEMIVIQFKTNGAFAILNQPLHHFTNEYVLLDCIFKNEAEQVWQQLKESKTIKEMFLVTENFLYRNLISIQRRNEMMLTEIEKMIGQAEPVPIEKICRELNFSRKHVNCLTKTYCGVSPKLLSSLFRFYKSLTLLNQPTPEKLTHVAYELDFFDQAHFINNFKAFTGMKPTEYIRLVEGNPCLKNIPHFLPAN